MKTKERCEATTHISSQDKWNYSTRCSWKAKYRMFNTTTKKTNYYCGIHIKNYYYNYNKKLQYPHLEITLIKEIKKEQKNEIQRQKSKSKRV